MELVLRKYVWAVNLAFIALAALLLARIVNLFTEAAIAPTTPPQASAPTSRPNNVESATKLNLEKLARITGLPQPVAEAVAEPGRENVDLNTAPVKSDLRVRLLGTLIGLPEWTFASIEDLGAQKVQDYRVGDKLLSAEVLEIERARVIILNNGRREYINNEAEAPPIAGGPAVRPPDGAAMAALGSGIRATGENSYEIPRNEIDRTLGDLNQVAMQARIVPAFKDGVAQGFKLFSIRPDSIYSKIGVVNGDVIKRINGFDLNSPEKALEIYSKLKEANRIDIEIERNGASIRKQYTVR